MLLQV
jgi:AAA domain